MAFKDYPLDPAAVDSIGDGIYVGPNMARNDVRPALQQLAADGHALFDYVNQILQQIYGTIYSSVAAGLAATASGGLFLVRNSDGTVTLYLDQGGEAVEQVSLATTSMIPVRPARSLGRVSAAMAQGATTRIMCLGDSVTDGLGTTGWVADHNAHVGDPAYDPPHAWPQVLEDYLRATLRNGNITVWNGGFSGQPTVWMLDNYDSIVAPMGSLDVVIINSGLNDEYIAGYSAASYLANKLALVKKIIARGAVPVLTSVDVMQQMGGAIGDGLANRQNVRASNEMAVIDRGIAQMFGIEFWDMHAAQLDHYHSNRDGIAGKIGIVQPDNLHGGDHHHAFKASYALKMLAPGRVMDLPDGRPSALFPWEGPAGLLFGGGGTAGAQIFHSSNAQPGSNVQAHYPTIPATPDRLLSALVWNPGPATALFAGHIGGAGNGATGMRFKVYGLSYSGLTLNDTLTRGDGMSFAANNAGLGGSDEKQFVCMLAHGLNHVEFREPTALISGGVGDVFPPVLKFFPNYAHAPSSGATYTNLAGAAGSSGELLCEAGGLFSPPGSGVFGFYPTADKADARNLLTFGASEAAATVFLWEATLPSGFGLLFNDGPLWTTDPTTDTGANQRAANYLYRPGAAAGVTSQALIWGLAHYSPKIAQSEANFDSKIEGTAFDWGATGRVDLLVEMWRDSVASPATQRLRVKLLDGTVVMDATRAITGRVGTWGGAIGGTLVGDRPTTNQARVLNRCHLVQMIG